MNKELAEYFASGLEADALDQIEVAERCEMLEEAVGGNQRDQMRLEAESARTKAKHWQQFAEFVRTSSN